MRDRGEREREKVLMSHSVFFCLRERGGEREGGRERDSKC